MNSTRLNFIIALLFTAPALAAGCSAPEHCHGCLARLADGGIPSNDVAAQSGGAPGVGGNSGAGGLLATGGTMASGGMIGTGGAATGGAATGGAASGGRIGTGGSASGGQGTGGAATGGTATGGAATGGAMGGMGGGATAGSSGLGGNGTDADLALWYKFDETSGTDVADSALLGGMARNGTLGAAGAGGTATFSTATKQVGTRALGLTPLASAPKVNGWYVTVPSSLHLLAPNALTISVWVYLRANTAAEDWERVYDFGSGGTALGNMYLTTRAMGVAMTPVRFAITNTGHAGTAEQRLDSMMALAAGRWYHIAVVLPAGTPYTGTLYIDGAIAATNPGMTLHMTDVGATINNWIGRSQFAGNSFFNGFIDDFRVYRRALSAAEIATVGMLR